MPDAATSDDGFGSRFAGLALGFFLLIFLLMVWDVASDVYAGASGAHVFVEVLVLIIAALASALLLRQIWRERQFRAALVHDLQASQAEAAAWREEAREVLRGLRAAIDRQFVIWGLSPAEAQVGLFLLKGLSLKEIAALRMTSERTVREQARALYRKAGVSGRSAFAAYFLEDLLLPPAA